MTFSCQIKRAFHDLDLDISFKAKKGITAIMGPSGSGKTTLCNIIAGLSGEEGCDIYFGETNLNILPPENRKIGYIFQDNLLFPHLTVRANLLYGMDKGDRATRMGNMISLFSLELLMDRHPETLSGGEQKRVAIARAILSNPDLLILDEPFSGIDPARRENLFPYLERLKSHLGIPILYVTHQMDEILRLADQVLMIENGKSAAFGVLEDVFSKPEFIKFIGPFDFGSLLEAKVIKPDLLEVKGGTLNVTNQAHKIGEMVKVRILARDVSLALEKPKGLSILNILPTKIIAIGEAHDGEVDIKLELQATKTDNPATIISRITQKSLASLKLKEGQDIFALIKAVAVSG